MMLSQFIVKSFPYFYRRFTELFRKFNHLKTLPYEKFIFFNDAADAH